MLWVLATFAQSAVRWGSDEGEQSQVVRDFRRVFGAVPARGCGFPGTRFGKGDSPSRALFAMTTVLVIDNDASTVELLSYVFQHEGYTVHTALDGVAGIALAFAHKPHVVVCDLLMDQMDGFQVLQTIRGHPELADTVVIVVSAKSYKPDIDRATELGADAYVVKPFSSAELLAAVKGRLEARAARQMTVRFWGTRGSIAVPGLATTTYGGNTSCVEARVGGDILIFDAGTGIRGLGLALIEEFAGRPLTVHLLISHTHWDHIQGFPFFTPAYAANTTIHLYGPPGQGRPLDQLLRGQMNPDYFPVALGDLAARIHVHEYRGSAFEIGETVVAATYLNHPGMTLGYRVTRAGKTLVYATDNEQYRTTLEHVAHRADAGRKFGEQLDEQFVAFVSDADLYIGEAQYTDEEYPPKIGWGHSPLSATVQVALKASVRKLALFHHDPMHTDDVVAGMETEARRLIACAGGTVHCFAAREGQTVDI
jgi:phosphoribosyl 1,2-cyclic phosphodiesterase/CheY-like chemotaxis protein